jgi:hypothetical protein
MEEAGKILAKNTGECTENFGEVSGQKELGMVECL